MIVTVSLIYIYRHVRIATVPSQPPVASIPRPLQRAVYTETASIGLHLPASTESPEPRHAVHTEAASTVLYPPAASLHLQRRQGCTLQRQAPPGTVQLLPVQPVLPYSLEPYSLESDSLKNYSLSP